MREVKFDKINIPVVETYTKLFECHNCGVKVILYNKDQSVLDPLFQNFTTFNTGKYTINNNYSIVRKDYEYLRFCRKPECQRAHKLCEKINKLTT